MGNNSRFFFVLLSVGAAIGLGNIFLYPYYSFKFTGLFFIPYLLALIFLCFPLLLLEFSIGQFFGKNVIDLFGYIRKWFSTIGWLMVLNAFIVMSYYAVVISWHIIYIFVSFGMQWKNNSRNYFLGNVIQVSNGISGFTRFSLPVFIALIFAWLVIFFCVMKGFESIKKSFLFILPAFVILMIFFFFYSLSLEGALPGVYNFLRPDFKSLLDINLWIAAFSSAIISLGLSFGVMHLFAAKSDKGFLFGNSVIVTVFSLVACIAFGFVLFGILGFLAAKSSIGLGGLVFPDSGSLFIVLPQALPFFYKPTLLSILFFVFLSLFFLLGAASLAYFISHIIVHKFNARHIHASILVSGLGFLSGMIFIVKPGFYIMDIVVHFVYYNILLAALLESVAVGWFFDSEKISSFINQYSKVKFGAVWRFLIRFIVPLILLLLIAFQMKSDLFAPYRDYPLWALLVFGAGTFAVPLVIAFMMPQKILDRR